MQEDLFKRLVAHCKEYGFVYPSSEVYEGLGGVYDYGPMGVELKNNIKEYWLRYKAVMQREMSVLEIGLGTGLIAMMTWLEAEKRALVVDYTGIELFPPPLDVIKNLNYPQLLGVPDRAADYCKLHTTRWGRRQVFSEVFSFTKHKVPIESFSSPDTFDLIYFDAFAPQAQPELWTVEIFKNMYESLRPEGILVTYCAQGEFKRSLKKAGFTVERLQGPPGKREMTRATRG